MEQINIPRAEKFWSDDFIYDDLNILRSDFYQLKDKAGDLAQDAYEYEAMIRALEIRYGFLLKELTERLELEI